MATVDLPDIPLPALRSSSSGMSAYAVTVPVTWTCGSGWNTTSRLQITDGKRPTSNSVAYLRDTDSDQDTIMRLWTALNGSTFYTSTSGGSGTSGGKYTFPSSTGTAVFTFTPYAADISKAYSGYTYSFHAQFRIFVD